jgi:hypothetical protein
MIIRSSTTGQIFVCNQCRKIHLEFGNFSYDFTSETKLNDFLNHLEQIDGLYYEELNKSSGYRRKILVPIPDTEIKILFTSNELEEIRNLIRSFTGRKRKELMNITRIEVDFRTFSPQHLN